jgi:tRNA-Thr(GGU) m(6)t(6)A37 methyltransferase TsaA
MTTQQTYSISPIGYVHSTLKDRSSAPKQASENAPSATIRIHPDFVDALDGIQPGQDIWIFTWLHQAKRSVLRVHPRRDPEKAMKGVFATRSPDRPNPIGLHLAKVLTVDPNGSFLVEAIEVVDGTPIVDIKPAIECTPK